MLLMCKCNFCFGTIIMVHAGKIFKGGFFCLPYKGWKISIRLQKLTPIRKKNQLCLNRLTLLVIRVNMTHAEDIQSRVLT